MGLIKGETDRYAKKLHAALEPDESLVLAVRVRHDTKDTGLLGVAVQVASAAVGPDDQTINVGSLAEQAPRKGMSLWALTTTRMAFFAMPATKLKAPTAAFALRDVTAVSATKAKVRYGKLALDFRDGSRIVFDMVSDREVDRINQEALRLLGPA